MATGHSHGAYKKEYILGNDVFSGISEYRGKDAPLDRKNVDDKRFDIGSSNKAGISDYLVTPGGILQHYDASSGEITIIATDMPKDESDTNTLSDIKKYYGQE